MPTPFYHLSIAQEILEQANQQLIGLPEWALTILQSQQPAFYLGNTAPDVQTLSGQERQVTHFFDLPVEANRRPAWTQLLHTYPELSRPERLPGDHAAFLAGYLCHLQADWNWVAEIFTPVFGSGNAWENYRHRLYLHNVLRSYLDLQIIPALIPHMAELLCQAVPVDWLPFVEDIYLVRWRDLLSGQLCDGCTVSTVEVFATRQGISTEEYYSLLDSEERLEQEIFAHLPRPALDAYRQNLIAENLQLLVNYFSDQYTT